VFAGVWAGAPLAFGEATTVAGTEVGTALGSTAAGRLDGIVPPHAGKSKAHTATILASENLRKNMGTFSRRDPPCDIHVNMRRFIG